MVRDGGLMQPRLNIAHNAAKVDLELLIPSVSVSCGLEFAGMHYHSQFLRQNIRISVLTVILH